MVCFRLFLALFFSGVVSGAGIAAEPSADELRQKFQETIAASRLPLEMWGGKLTGPGLEFLIARAGESQFVLIGEEHGVATIADTVRAYFTDLNDLGYRHIALEADPYMTERMERTLRAGGTKALAKLLSADDAKFALPFYSWSAEAALANAVEKAKGSTVPALWGLDQVFIGAYGVLLKDISEQTVSADARALAGQLTAQARGDLEFLSKVEIAEFEKLRRLLVDQRDSALAALVDDMILSAKIYAPFIGKTGLSVYAANLERENYMKRQFLLRYGQAGKPKVFFKFGGNHMSVGLSGTHVPALANFVSDYAMAEGVKAFNVFILCGPGSKAGDFLGNTVDCDMSVAKDFPDLVGAVDSKQPTLFDLRGWKDKPRRWEHMSQSVRELVWAYDAILFVPNGKPASFLK